MTISRAVRSAAILIALAAGALGFAARAGAQDAPAESSPRAAAPRSVTAPAAAVTPRSSMHGFLATARQGDYERAAGYLDLSRIDPGQRAEVGRELAWKLKVVLDRELWVDLDQLSNDPAGAPDDGLPARRDRVGSIETAAGSVAILLERVAAADAAQVWRVAASTVDRVPDLYDEFGYGALGEWLPSLLFERQFLDVQLWQWLGLLLLLFVAWLGSWVVVRAAWALLRPVVERSSTTVDDRFAEAAIGPVRLAVAVSIISAGSYALALSVPAQRLIHGTSKLAAVVAAAWLALRIIDLLSVVLVSRMDASGQRAAQQFVPLGRKTIKVFVCALAVLAALDSFGFDVTALIASLGIGGLAVALALQKTLENLFGGATLLADRPVAVGEFCRFGDKVGTVEEIGIRSTRVRTLDRTLVSVPNADFATTQLENFTRRDKIWYHPTIGLRYETTPEQLRYVLVEVRKMLYAHPKVDPDPARIRFTSFGAYSLDLEIFAYVQVTDYAEFLEVAEDLNLRIMDIVETAGTGFAFPSNTTYLAQDSEPDATRVEAAEAAVRGWREQGELYLPGFPEEKIAELSGSLEYPPPGSPQGRS